MLKSLILLSSIYFQAADTSSLITEGVINTPPHSVYEVFTSNEGWKKLGVAKADIEFKIGGLMKTHYSPEGVIGDKGTIMNQILAYDPDRMLSFKIYQAPEGFPFREAMKSVWTVIYFEPVEANKTKMTIKMLGYGPDEESQRMRKFFESGNKTTIDFLKKALEK